MNNIILLNAENIIKHAIDIRLYIGGEMFDNGVLCLTNFRLLWTLASHQREMALADINKIESYAGFFNMSSPKIILDLVKIQEKLVSCRQDWECKICSTINIGQNDKCSECGVKCVQENYKNDGKACQKCTFFNIAGNVCQMCQNPLCEEIIQIKLSFRQGGMPEFLAELQKYWTKKEWEDVKLQPIGGVATVLDRLNEAKIKDDQVILSAFSDLKALMNSAQEMVQLASSIAAKVASAKELSDSESEEIIQFRNSLMTLGISDPVTRKEAKNEYVKKLANQIQEFLDLFFKTRHPKIISTVDLYCLFNRARGLNLISPHDLMKAVESFSSDIDSKYRLRCFSGGGKFVQSCKLNDDEFYAKILKLFKHQDFITSSTIAVQENISIILAKEELFVYSFLLSYS